MIWIWLYLGIAILVFFGSFHRLMRDFDDGVDDSWLDGVVAFLTAFVIGMVWPIAVLFVFMMASYKKKQNHDNE